MRVRGLQSLLVFFLVIAGFAASGQEKGYHISYTLHNIKDTMAWLCQVYGKEVIAVDSCLVKKDKAEFSGQQHLDYGVYKIVFNDTLFTDIIFTGEEVELESYFPAIIPRMKVHKSKENRVLFSYWQYYFRMQDSMDDVIERGRKIYYANQGKPSKELDILQQRSDDLDDEKYQYIMKLQRDYPELFAPKLILSFQKPDYRFYLIHDGKPYPSEEEYYRAHFFDNLDFGDRRMLQTEVLYVMINDYMKTFTQSPSTATYISLTDEILNRARADSVVYQYCIELFIKNFESTIWDQVFIHLVETHYIHSPLANEALKKVYLQRVKAIRNTSIGSKVQDVCGQTVEGGQHCLRPELGTRTLLLFWSPGCEHCEAILPDLVKINNEYSEKGLKIFAFAIADTRDTLDAAIRKFGLNFINISDYKGFFSETVEDFNINITPMMFLLDEEGIITDKPGNIPTLYANLVIRYKD
jgi:thiol-disulfide isomerase/thioredoxin